MALTPAQKQTLKADILATPAANTLYVDGDLSGLVAFYNAASSPAYIVWKTNVPLNDVGRTFNAAELAGLTQLNTSRLHNLAAWLATGVNPSVTSVRQFFDDIFSGAGGTNTRAALLDLWKRTATRFERVFATGTGTTPTPGLLVVEGSLTVNDLIGL